MSLAQWLKTGLVICGLLLPKAIASTSNAAPATSPSPLVPKLNWQPCTSADQKGFQCATAQVPLDYQNPNGESIQLAVIKHPATDQSHRIGSLFFNPGGPGGPGTKQMPAWFSQFPTELTKRFNIISFDPRGIGDSTPVQCGFDNADKVRSFFTTLPQGFPVGEAEIKNWLQGYTRLGQLCEQTSGKLLAHVSTAEVAMDMDLLRRAVGDPMFNYIGLSYGTYLGATYANLFPNKVRAMVLDGNVDPVAWSNGGKDETNLSTMLRLGMDLAAAKTLKAFLNLCGQASKDHCAFSAGSPQKTEAKFNALLEKLRQQPVVIDGKTTTYAVLLAVLNESLSIAGKLNGVSEWTTAADQLQKAWDAPAATSPDPLTIRLVLPELGALVVACAESPNPRNPEAFRQLDVTASKRAGAMGPNIAWIATACATWPAKSANRYTGPWNRPTANPILVIGNTYDPATRYEGSIAMARELARARLLTVDGYGHTVFLNPSRCANHYITNYFMNGQLPPVGTTCKQDYQPFSASSNR
jgi:pimeloyl-ACP methyl ester carboxylesterase